MVSEPNLAGKTFVVTGATSGVGRETALMLGDRGARVVIVGRDRERAENVAQAVPDGLVVVADFGSLAEVREAARAIADEPQVDALISNAATVPERRQSSRDGYEMQLAVNHLAPFLLVHLLRDKLAQSAPSRVVVVASQVERHATRPFEDLQSERSYSPHQAYYRSKLFNVMFTYELARRLEATGVTANCLHPGVLETKLLATLRATDPNRKPAATSGWGRLRRAAGRAKREARRLAGRPPPRGPQAEPEVGARAVLHLATDAALDGVTGAYFKHGLRAQTSPYSRDLAAARQLWEESERLCGIAPPA